MSFVRVVVVASCNCCGGNGMSRANMLILINSNKLNEKLAKI